MSQKISEIRKFMKKSKIAIREIAEEAGYTREQMERIFRGDSPFHEKQRKVIENSIRNILSRRRELEEEWKKISH